MNCCSPSEVDLELEEPVFSLTLLTKPDILFLNAEAMVAFY